MAALAITAVEVIQGEDVGAGAGLEEGRAGVAVTAGMTLYYDELTDRFYPADADSTIQGAFVVGIALNGAGPGQTVRMQTDGRITIGATAAVGVGIVYVQGATPGSIVPVADLIAAIVPWYVTTIGVGAEDDSIVLGIFPSGVLAP